MGHHKRCEVADFVLQQLENDSDLKIKHVLFDEATTKIIDGFTLPKFLNRRPHIVCDDIHL